MESGFVTEEGELDENFIPETQEIISSQRHGFEVDVMNNSFDKTEDKSTKGKLYNLES